MAFFWILSHSEVETPSNPWTSSCESNSLIKIVRLGKSLCTDLRVSCVLSGWHSSSQKLHLPWKSGMSYSNSQPNRVLHGWPGNSDDFHRASPRSRHGNRSTNIRIKCSIYEEHRRSANFHTLGSTNGNLPILCQEGPLRLTWPFHWRFVSPLIIVATDISRISALKHIVPGHKYAQYRRH
jgi:hypothetical protein